MFEAMDYFNYRHKEEAEDKSYYYGFDGGFVGNGLNGRRRSCGGGFFGGGLGCGLGGGVGLEGGVVRNVVQGGCFLQPMVLHTLMR